MDWHITNFDIDDFVAEYWQKQPCLIRQAFPDVESPITPEELAGLACEEAVHSRLVMEKGGESAWQLRYGPFTENDFTALPDSHYSLLVSECEKWIPEIQNLLSAFDFLPNWRIDDAMLSYAPPGGSVGPHVDEYDVFLLQLQGKRHWHYDKNKITNPTLISDLDLAILASFTPEQEATLEPGDMLYLPPGVAHHGVALDACLTCSIGFRAPTASEILESFALEIDKQDLGKTRYSDKELETDRHPAEITLQEIDQFKRMVLNLHEQPQSLWIDAIGKLLSDTVINNESKPEYSNDIGQIKNHTWIVNPDTRLLYHREDSNIRFYYNGQCELLPAEKMIELWIQRLNGMNELESEFLDQTTKHPLLASLLVKMIDNNAIIPDENQ